MSVRRPVLAAALAGAILFATPLATASAQTNVHRDPSGDVVSGTDDSDTTTKQPTVSDGDVVRATASYTRHAVYASESFRSLTRTGDDTLHEFLIGGSNGALAVVIIDAWSGDWAGESLYIRGSKKATKTCHGLTHRIDYTAKRVSIRVPRSCLHSPRKVHVSSATIRRIDGTSSQDDTSYIDDARSTGMRSDGNLRWSPWLRRG